MGRLLYTPFSIVAGLLASFGARKLFEQVWGMIDSEEPPDPKHRDISASKMIAAVAIQGAIFAAVRGALDHYTRRTFMRLTGSWPGEEEPESE